MHLFRLRRSVPLHRGTTALLSLHMLQDTLQDTLQDSCAQLWMIWKPDFVWVQIVNIWEIKQKLSDWPITSLHFHLHGCLCQRESLLRQQWKSACFLASQSLLLTSQLPVARSFGYILPTVFHLPCPSSHCHENSLELIILVSFICLLVPCCHFK